METLEYFTELRAVLCANPGLLTKTWQPALPRGTIAFGERDLRLKIQPTVELEERRTLWVVGSVRLLIDGGLAARGKAARIMGRSALVVALAEAWERILMRKLAPMRLQRVPTLEGSGAGGWAAWQSCTSSNGFAAGLTLAGAARAAAAELFERHCVLAAWNRELPPVRLKTRGPWWLALERRAGWDFAWYRLGTTDELTTVACLARHSREGARFDAVAVPSSGVGAGVRRSATSVLRMIHDRGAEKADFDALWRAGDPTAHQLYYCNPKRLSAFDFLDSSAVAIPAKVEDFRPTLVPLCLPGELPAVARAQWEPAKPLCWGEASLAFCPANPYPHPIA